MKIRNVVVFLPLTLCMTFPASQADLRLNQIQFIGSHNSYKQAVDPRLLKLILKKDSTASGLDYHHLPLYDQLELGLRGLEIDVLHDPSGGRFQYPQGIVWAKHEGITLPVHDPEHVLSHPGIKVLHEPDIDFRTSCLTLKNCLSEVLRWSTAHPNHRPVLITINTKDSGLTEPGATKVLPFNNGALDSLDAEILSVFSGDKLITPFLLQGNAVNLRAAILSNGWPLLSSVGGKVMFILDSPDEITNRYLSDGKQHPMFANVGEDNPNAAFFIMNEPKDQQEKIAELEKKGYMVRTRADADTWEARSMDYTRWKSAKASGAQLISTDYYLSKLSPNGKFEISFSDHVYSRCNPVTYLGRCAE